MARRWLVKDDDGFVGGFTDDDDVDAPTGYTATTIADDATGVPADGPRSGGEWDVATSTYTLSPSQTNETDTDVINAFQKQRLHDAYKYFQIHGRTQHWEHLRSGDNAARPLAATDRWAYQLPAIGYNILEEEWPPTPLSAENKILTIDWLVTVLMEWGPTWYSVMVGEDVKTDGGNAGDYLGQLIGDGESIYTDTVKADGSTRPLDGAFIAYGDPPKLAIPTGYNPEIPALVNP